MTPDKRRDISYSIWVIPEGRTYRLLTTFIQHLAREYGSIAFEPHVTIIGGFVGDEAELREKSQQLARQFRPFSVTLTRIGYKNERFRSLFAYAKSSELTRVEQAAKQLFNAPVIYKDSFFHNSLLYGEFEEHRKARSAEQLAHILPMTFEAKAFHLVQNREREMKWPEIASYPLMH